MKEKNIKTCAIIAAAGTGSRMGGEVTKQRLILGGMSIIRRTVLAFEKCSLIDGIVLAAKKEEIEYMKEELRGISKLRAIVEGGKTRQESVANAFSVIDGDTDIVAIHDGARCLITEEMICEVISAAIRFGAATAAASVYDTVKLLDEDGFIKSTVDRNSLKFAQTPQVFEKKLYERAMRAVSDAGSITDDNMLIEALGEPIAVVDVGRENLKVTTPFDLSLAELILRKRGEIND